MKQSHCLHISLLSSTQTMGCIERVHLKGDALLKQTAVVQGDTSLIIEINRMATPFPSESARSVARRNHDAPGNRDLISERVSLYHIESCVPCHYLNAIILLRNTNKPQTRWSPITHPQLNSANAVKGSANSISEEHSNGRIPNDTFYRQEG